MEGRSQMDAMLGQESFTPGERFQIDSYQEPSFEAICRAIEAEKAIFSRELLQRYHLSLRARRFVVLYGVSGSGKTLLTRAYARAVNATYLLVPVAPNWTSNEDLLGFFNPLDRHYHDTDFSNFLRQASRAYHSAVKMRRTPRPFHLVLDEMNLARVEYYFAKFLSGMEILTDKGIAAITLAGTDTVDLTPNLFFIGTVNIDETTHGFADKVYDRAQVIEVTHSRERIATRIDIEELRSPLMDLWDAVADVAPFSFRVIDEINRYVNVAIRTGIPWDEALDDQICQKILPKVRGTDVRLGIMLQKLQEITATRFPRANGKIQQLINGYQTYGIVSYL